MTSEEFQRRVDDLKSRAHGNWSAILLHLGLDERMIARKANMPCPMCGGEDRFQYTDKYGEGNYHCRNCGPGGGFKLAQAATGRSFNAVLEAVERFLCLSPAMAPDAASELSGLRMKKLVQRIWGEARPVTAGDEAGEYLANRGIKLDRYPEVLRFHPALGYFVKDESGKARKTAEYPAMLACIQAADGSVAALHRTYLLNGQKLDAEDAKKMLGTGNSGAAIRLWPATGELSIAEGIETAIAVHLSTGNPVWSAVCAGNLEKLWVPETVRKISIYADNDSDSDFVGQACAFALARRLRRKDSKRVVRVFVPKRDGSDWLDVWQWRWQAARRLVA